MKSVEGRVAVVTGASEGLGREFATLAAKDGFDVILTARSVDKLEAHAASLRRAYNVAVEVMPADLTDPVAVERLWDQASAGRQIACRRLRRWAILSHGWIENAVESICKPKLPALAAPANLSCRHPTPDFEFRDVLIYNRARGDDCPASDFHSFQHDHVRA